MPTASVPRSTPGVPDSSLPSGGEGGPALDAVPRVAPQPPPLLAPGASPGRRGLGWTKTWCRPSPAPAGR
eukprot:594114-Alexandrium_andersonii.AAC.1